MYCQRDGYDGNQDTGHCCQEQTRIGIIFARSFLRVDIEKAGHSLADAIPRTEGQDGGEDGHRQEEEPILSIPLLVFQLGHLPPSHCDQFPALLSSLPLVRAGSG